MIHPNCWIVEEDDERKNTGEDPKNTARMEKKQENERESECENDDFKSDFPINNLSPEILLNIFSYLDITTLITTVFVVCKSWYSIAHDQSLWRTLSFTKDGEEAYHYIGLILRMSPHLRNLYVHSALIKTDLTSIAYKSWHLRTLSLKFCDIPIDNLSNFEALIQSCEHVTCIDLEGSKVPREILDTLSGAVNVRDLNLSHCVNLDNEILIAISKNCKLLDTLNIDGINCITDCAINQLLTLRFDSLQSLILDGEALSDAPFSAIVRCSKLQQFSMSFCPELSDRALKKFQTLHKLEFLKLRKGIQLSARGLQEMFTNGNWSCLSHLNLGECLLLEDSTLMAVADQCPNLCYLGLQWCWEVTDEGISVIVKKCSSLRVLDLVGLVRLMGNFLRDLNDQVPHLKVLDLEQCSCIDDDTLQELASKRPTLRIFNYWGDVVE